MTPAARAATLFTDTFGGTPDGLWWAPGRVNLVGEHTDYNDGLVLPFALGQGVAVAARANPRPVLRVRSAQQPRALELALRDVGPGTVPGWAAYVAGVPWALRRAGHRLPGLDLVVDGDVPLGAGLSSSAALTCAVALACDDIAGLGLPRTALAAAARRAENDVAGAPTGVMDQLASLLARDGHLMLLDTRTLDVTHVPFDPAAAGLALLVVDTRTPHALVDGEYARRRRSCHAAAARLGVPALRDATPGDLARLDDDLLRRRARHVVTENARVADVAAALRAGADPRTIGPLLTASHASMRDDFAITVPQVDLAVTAALDAGAHGARMTGGGFGGCVVALTERTAAAHVAAHVAAAYAAAGYRPPATFTTRPHAGARRVTPP